VDACAEKRTFGISSAEIGALDCWIESLGARWGASNRTLFGAGCASPSLPRMCSSTRSPMQMASRITSPSRSTAAPTESRSSSSIRAVPSISIMVGRAALRLRRFSLASRLCANAEVARSAGCSCHVVFKEMKIQMRYTASDPKGGGYPHEEGGGAQTSRGWTDRIVRERSYKCR